MNTAFRLLILFMSAFLTGCRKSMEFPAPIKPDIEILRQEVLSPSIDPTLYANRLCDKIAALQDSDLRHKCQNRWEDLLYQIQVVAPDLRTRYSQFEFFCDIAGVASYCILKCGGTYEAYWDSRLRMLKWMQNQLSVLEPPIPIAPTDHRPRSKQELMRDGYWDMFHSGYDFRVEQLEKGFNDRTCPKISKERQQDIRQKFERVLGRKIRTDWEIKEQGRMKRKLLCEKLGLDTTAR